MAQYTLTGILAIKWILGIIKINGQNLSFWIKVSKNNILFNGRKWKSKPIFMGRPWGIEPQPEIARAMTLHV